MKKLIFYIMVLCCLVGFAEQIAKPLPNVNDNRLFVFKKNLLLQDSTQYAFIISNFGNNEVGISLSENDTITYITYIPSIDKWLRDRNSTLANGDTIPPMKKFVYKVKVPTHKDYQAIQSFIQSIVSNAKSANQPPTVFDGISWLIMAEDNWAVISTANESYEGHGEITDILSKIAIACENSNPQELTSAYLSISNY